MAEQNNQDGNQAENIIWACVGVAILVFLFWYIFREKIVIFFLYLADYKLRFIELFYQAEPTSYFGQLRIWINNINPANFSLRGLYVLNKTIGFPFAIVTALFMVFWAGKLYLAKTYTRNLDTKTLAESEKEIWPGVIPSLVDDILAEDPVTGRWALSRSPVEFIKHHRLLNANGELNEEKARKVITQTLGKKFKGLNSFNKYELALFGIFASAIIGDRKEAYAALDELNRSYERLGGKDVDVSIGIDLVKKYAKDPRVKRLYKRHTYKNTVLYQSLMEARESIGVLPSAEFLWLKPLSRHSWYILNNVGRRVSWADTLGVFCHWITESIHGQGISKPYVENGVAGLKEVIKRRVIEY